MFNRDQIEEKYKWNLNDILKSYDEFEELFSKLDTKKCLQYVGKLNNEKDIFDYLQMQQNDGEIIEKLYCFARMKWDENTKDNSAQQLTMRVDNLAMNYAENNSFAMPELSANSDEFLQELAKKPNFQNHDRFFARLIAKKQHILSKEEEKILALSSQAMDSFSTTFNMFDNADITFENVVDDLGRSIPLSHSSYSIFLQNADQTIRKSAFENYYKPYIANINTIASNYAGNVYSDVFYSKAKKYDSSLQMALFGEEVDKKVYEKLIDCISSNLQPMHDYIAYRKQALNLQTLNMYDLYCPIVEGENLQLEYEDAYQTFVNATKVMGEEYTATLKEAFNGNWIDVFPTPNKKSGAYSWGVYGVHPFVLLNYEKTTHDVFTIAHEMGHAMHSYYSNKHNAPQKAEYKIFVAEIASTVNEVLLLKYLLKDQTDAKKRANLLSYYLDMFRTTMFRQTMFSEFESIVHENAEKGEPLTADSMNEIYLNLNKKYYGEAVQHNTQIAYEWARIPHFYRSFYVYKYATGLISAVNIANKLLTEKDYSKKYLAFLQSGNRDKPTELLKIADVDLTTSQPYDFAIAEFKSTLAELKK